MPVIVANQANVDFTAHNQFWIVAPNVSISNGALADFSNTILQNYGNIFKPGPGGGGQIFDYTAVYYAFSTVNHRLSNEAGAIISGYWGVFLDGIGLDLRNHGSIVGMAQHGVQVGGAGNGLDLYNSASGSIYGFLGGVTVSAGSAVDIKIDNAGTISSAQHGIWLTNIPGAKPVIINSGTIQGDTNSIFAEAGDRLDVTNSGQLIGNVRGTSTDQADSVTNNGSITGDVFLGSGIDSYKGTGSVSGTVFGEAGNDTLTGGNVADRLNGGADQDTLNGLAGADVMSGEQGNDIYVVDNTGDQVIELLDQGNDLVQSAVSFTLGANVERLTLTGAAANNGIGNALANIITGNGAANILDGGAGIDTLIGGGGDDTYVLADGADSVTDTAGIDTITSTITRSLASFGTIDKLTLLGTSAINGTGNGLANAITGNGAANILDGGLLTDTLIGGGGDDTYVVDNTGDQVIELLDQGNDLVQSAVSFTLGANVERLTLTGAAANNGIGNAIANIITGNGAANILDGGAGTDTLIGGGGDDTYVLADGTDIVTDTAGIDTITSTITRSLASFGTIDKLTLLGTSAINGTGNGLANAITGNGAANILDGGLLTDTLIGGGGDDTYVLADGADIVTDTAGIDTITSTITRSLATFTAIEKLTLTGTLAINGTGNALANTITGNGKNNTLTGLGANDILIGGIGNDVMVGGAGKDTMTGGAGNDRFDFNSITEIGRGATRDVITGFVHLVDKIDLATIDANGAAPGNAFTFLAGNNAAFTGVAGQLRWFRDDQPGTLNDKTIIEGDTNGNKVADFQIQLSGLKTLTAADFVL